MGRLLLFALIAAAVVFFLTRAKSGGSQGRSLRLWAKLHSLTHDRDLADRLVAGEMRRNPELSELQCVKRAIAQIERDRGR